MGFALGRAYRLVQSVFAVLVVLCAFCAAFHTVSDYDMGWHLATGRYVVQHHTIPRTDVLSFTSQGKPWTYPPFAGVLFYLVYSYFGYAGLTWLCALACSVVVAYLIRRGDIGTSLLAMFATQSIAARCSPRADIFTIVFFAFFLATLWDYRYGKNFRLWLLPVIMALWVNLHPGFIAGIGAISAYLLAEILDLVFPKRRHVSLSRLKQSWPWLAACALATFLNPWGLRIYSSALTLSGLIPPSRGSLNSGTFIAEFKSVPISRHLFDELIDVRHMENGFAWLLLIAAFLVGLFLWKRMPGNAIVVSVALYCGIAHARYMALFVVSIVVLGGPALSELLMDRLALESDEVEKSATPRWAFERLLVALLVVGAACAVTVLHAVDFISSRTYVVFNSDWRFGAGESSWFPSRAASFIQDEQLPHNIFEEYALGGYVTWRLGPQYRDFIDGRGDRLSPDLVVEQQKLYSEPPDSPAWQTAAERWNLNVMLITTSGFRGLQKLDPLGFCQSQAWRPVYMDDVSLVVIRNTPANRHWLDQLQIDCQAQTLSPPQGTSRSSLYDFYLNSGALFFELHRDQEAQESLRRASALYPEDPNSHLLLAYLYQRQQRLGDAEQEYLRSIALNESEGALYSVGLLYAREGRAIEAVQSLERAAELSVDPVQIYMTLGQLQLILNHPESALVAFDKAEAHSAYRNGAESLAPELYAEIAEGRSEAAMMRGRWREAVAFQEEATKRTPSVAKRWNSLADLYQRTGQEERAAEARQRMQQLTQAIASSSQ